MIRETRRGFRAGIRAGSVSASLKGNYKMFSLARLAIPLGIAFSALCAASDRNFMSWAKPSPQTSLKSMASDQLDTIKALHAPEAN